MEITCNTRYDRRALAAKSLAARKTLRRRFDRLVRIYLWVVAALMAVSLLLSLDEPPSAALYAVFFALLVALQLRQDAINAFFAHRRQIPGSEVSRTVFHPDCYVVTFLGAEARWQYDKILLPLETRDYFILLLGKANAHALPKSGLEGASPDQFRAFLAEKTGKPVQRVRRWNER